MRMIVESPESQIVFPADHRLIAVVACRILAQPDNGTEHRGSKLSKTRKRRAKRSFGDRKKSGTRIEAPLPNGETGWHRSLWSRGPHSRAIAVPYQKPSLEPGR